MTILSVVLFAAQWIVIAALWVHYTRLRRNVLADDGAVLARLLEHGWEIERYYGDTWKCGGEYGSTPADAYRLACAIEDARQYARKELRA